LSNDREKRALEKQAKITSKGRITVPLAIRKALGAGDVLLFEEDKAGVRVRAVRAKSRFAKYRGVGNRRIGSGKKAIIRWTRAMRER
jgi:bifunctional DNA-binding transcriptional regulator/antitoxin component of YhaV-PrlF toxin-antitoxin module